MVTDDTDARINARNGWARATDRGASGARRLGAAVSFVFGAHAAWRVCPLRGSARVLSCETRGGGGERVSGVYESLVDR